MATTRTPFLDGEYYHIYNRGNNKQQIFFDKSDYERFVKLLYLCNSEKKINFKEDIIERKIDAWDFKRNNQIVSINAWVLMPNHFHLYLTNIPKDGRLGISFFIKKVCTAYSKYINAKYNRTGTLFEGRFRSVQIKDDNQAKYLFSYIHLNPIKLIQKDWKEEGIKDKKEAIDFLNNYKYSSYLDYKEINRGENKILDKGMFLNYFSNKEELEDEIFEWLTFKEDI